MYSIAVLLGAFMSVSHCYLGDPKFVLTPEGINVTLPVNGYRVAAIHFNINKPLLDIEPGDQSRDFHTEDLGTDGNSWSHLFNVNAKEGDTINYWVWGEINGEGEQRTNLHTILGPISSTPKTTSKANSTTSTSRTTEQSRNSTHDKSRTQLASDILSTLTSHEPTTRTSSSASETHVNPLYPLPSSVPKETTRISSSTRNSLTSLTSFTVDQEKRPSTLKTSGMYETSNNWHPPNEGYLPSGLSGELSCCKKDYSCKSYPCLIFDEEFNVLNPCLWEHEITAGGNPNSEFQYYINNRTNSYIRNGVLYIKPTLTADRYGDKFLTSGTLDLWGGFGDETCTSNAYSGCLKSGSVNYLINPVQSARLRSKRGFCFKYGKLEIEAELPKGDWLRPYFKLLPRWGVYGGWPASGEIDVVEGRGNIDYHDYLGQSRGVDNIHASLHFGPSPQEDRFYMASSDYTLMKDSFAGRFHNFSLEWDDTHITFAVDDREIMRKYPRQGGFWELGGLHMTNWTNPWTTSNMAPFDQELLEEHRFSLTIGQINPKPWRDASEYVLRDFWQARDLWYPTWNPNVDNGEGAALKIKSIKVWKMKP